MNLSLRAAVKDQDFGSLRSNLEALVKEHDSLFSILQIVDKEIDAFREVFKQSQAGLNNLKRD